MNPVLPFLISLFDSNSATSRATYQGLAAKKQEFSTNYHRFLKTANNQRLTEISLEADKLSDIFFITNLITDLTSRFTTQLEAIFSLKNRSSAPNTTIEPLHKNFAELFEKVFLIQRALVKRSVRTEPPLLLKGLEQVKSHLNLPREENDTQVYKNLKNTINALYEPYALQELFKKNYLFFKQFSIAKQIPLLVTILQNKVGEPILKWSKQLLCVLNDFVYNLWQKQLESTIETFGGDEEVSEKFERSIAKSRSTRDRLSSVSNQLYRECGLGNSNDEIQMMREKVFATEGNVDKLIELFEREAKPN